MRRVSTPDGRALTVREAGDPGGVPVVIIPGTPGSSIFYDSHVRDAEQRGIRLVSYARPGYEGSSRLEGRTVADCAADIEALCEALGIERCCVWGISGGGPHALAAAALLPERVAAAASLAGVAPYDAKGLDFFAGMGEQNVEEFKIVFEGAKPHRAMLERDRKELLSITPDELVETWQSLLGPADREVATGEFAKTLLVHLRAGIEASLDGWFDDDVAMSLSWGFELGSIRVPVLVWQGEQDRFVPLGHGRWLAEHIPGVEARFTADDGHLTLGQRRVPEVHAWLLDRASLNGNA